MDELRRQLAEVLAQFDAAKALEPYELISALEPVKQAATAEDQTIDEVRFEFIAMYLVLYDEPNVWGTHEGPELSDKPPLESITSECVDYWAGRMREARHPALRARYADLVWEYGHKVGQPRSIDAVRIAIDGYIEVWAANPQMSFHNWGYIHERAVNLALQIRDEERLLKTVKGLREYAAIDVEQTESEHRRRMLLSILLNILPKRRPQEQFQAVVVEFRNRLDELDAADADKFAIGDIAIPLAHYYRSNQQLDEAQAVLRIWGRSVQRLATATSSGMLASGWLREVHDLYPQFQMNDDARDLVADIETASAGIEEELVRISHSVEIPQGEFDRVINDLTSGTREEVIRKIAVNFLPHMDDAERLVRETASNSIYMNLTQSIVADDGRVTATIGPVADDLEGHVVQQLGQTMQFYGQIYRHAIEAATRLLTLVAYDFIAWLGDSPLFVEDRLQLLKPTFTAYLNGDWATAIHLAIPQIENALRQVLVLSGTTILRADGNGTLMVKNLNQVLRDPVVQQALPDDVRFYLRILLCDQRGLNIRNNVCHGLWSSEHFNWYTADRVMHAVLLIGILRPTAPAVCETRQQEEGGDS